MPEPLVKKSKVPDKNPQLSELKKIELRKERLDILEFIFNPSKDEAQTVIRNQFVEQYLDRSL